MASRIREFVGDWDAIWGNIVLRSEIKKAIVDLTKEHPKLLEANHIVRFNDYFHLLTDKVREKTGKLDNERILFEFKEWLKKEVKKDTFK